ncbi:MAG: helix-turn-helix domain-containing protein [Devosia nanyangense]|uniref:Helix-turn-helix domain-containing protein n=1 Tax=Devosia nanyangense TaxID=1228055 RepID=A0A933L2D9_9HYPH|nr:helix-turn-helix domain-containing protein [Devosia nanyangense]
MLLTHKETARQLGISPSKLFGLVADKKFPAPIHIGRSARYLDSEVNNWVAARAAERPTTGVQ